MWRPWPIGLLRHGKRRRTKFTGINSLLKINVMLLENLALEENTCPYTTEN